MSQEPPKKVGIFIAGLGGNNVVTLAARYLANNRCLEWKKSQAGKVKGPNWNGCITQLEPSGVRGGVGFKGRYSLADAGQAAIGGWDIRSTPLGDACTNREF